MALGSDFNLNTHGKIPLMPDYFELIFDAAPGPYLILSPDFTIVAVNNAYLEATNTVREEIIGRGLFEIFPDNPDDPEATGVRNLTASLRRVIKNKTPDAMGVQKYDIPRPKSKGGGFEERHWSPLNCPVLDHGGKLIFIIHSVVDVTQFVKLQKIHEHQLEITDQLKVQNRLFQAQVDQGAKEIKERKKAEAQLRKVDKIKSEFILLASHQLRTPATAVKGFISLLVDHYAGELSLKQRQLLKSAYAENERQIQLINEILVVAQAETGEMTLDMRPVDVMKLVNSVVYEQRLAFKDRKQEVAVKGPKSLPHLMADSEKVRIVIENLVSNAGKFSPIGRKILVEVKAQPAGMEINVTDSGPGIAKNDMNKLFKKFSRVSKSDTAKAEGSGLGLYLAKRIVDLHGGKINVHSEVGRKTTFTVQLPYKKGRD